MARGDKTLPRIQNRFRPNPKTLFRDQNTSQNPKTLPRIQKHFPESKSVLDSGNYFGFWYVFCPYEPRYLYLCIIHYLLVYPPSLTHWVSLTAADLRHQSRASRTIQLIVPSPFCACHAGYSADNFSRLTRKLLVHTWLSSHSVYS